jgi:hypothetical protein
MNPATGTGPRQVASWKRLTDNRLGSFGSFMVLSFRRGWFNDTPAFHHEYTRFLGEHYRHNEKSCPTDGRAP